jgi:hypothetical protein
MDDDTSVVQVLAKSLGNNEWIYVDTFFYIHDLPYGNNCFRIHTTTYNTKKYKFVPVLKLIPFDCNSEKNPIVLKRHLTYDSNKDSLSGNDIKVYLKNGPNDFFPSLIFRRNLQVIHVSALDE